jgi:hypothetical protein
MKDSGNPTHPVSEVTSNDVLRLFGDVDTETLVEILALNPSFAEIEEAALRVAGNGEAVGRTQATGTVAAILDLLEPYVEEDITPSDVPHGT